ncbi:pectinesterase family protein [Roseibium suaedae]|uniref:Pectinesterase n=1 Tax=Roseibium suaedae TaxID=735517 RepID=A0A1M7FR77_9HYPH|nr:pectinesterase family protein [Roseibium suaedae]SHM06278.1 pectinesterase [Roseibium suaedae]
MKHPAPVRPLLSPEQAGFFQRSKVLSLTGAAGAEEFDPWDPDLDGFMTGPEDRPSAHVAEPGQDSLLKVIDKAVRLARQTGSRERIYIELLPGTYTGLVYVPGFLVDGSPVPITLFSRDEDPSQTVIEADIDAEMPGSEYAERFAAGFDGLDASIADIYRRIAAEEKINTLNASVLRVENEGFQLRNVTVRNLYNCDREDMYLPSEKRRKNARGQYPKGQHQAVALLIAGADRVHLENVHLSSFQDTLYFRSPRKGTTVRSFYRRCDIEGDVDFIFGQATAYFDKCVIRSRGSRAGHAYVAAPSTDIRTTYGIVFHDCEFTHDGDPSALRGTFNLGRQWFEAVRATPYGEPSVPGYSCRLGEVSAYAEPEGTVSRETLFSVGKCVLINCRVGPHINKSAPWAEWMGGTFGADGHYAPQGWSLRYRPVQVSARDFLENLKDWPDFGLLDVSGIDPGMVLLGEIHTEET